MRLLYFFIALHAQELLYLSLKFLNNIWVLAELKITPGQPTLAVSWSHWYREERTKRRKMWIVCVCGDLSSVSNTILSPNLAGLEVGDHGCHPWGPGCLQVLA